MRGIRTPGTLDVVLGMCSVLSAPTEAPVDDYREAGEGPVFVSDSSGKRGYWLFALPLLGCVLVGLAVVLWQLLG